MAPIWVKSTAQKLRDSDVVAKVTVWPAKLTVRYKTRVLERYWFMPGPVPRHHIYIDRDNGRINHEIPIGQLVDSELLPNTATGTKPEFKYLSIGRKAWKKANTIEQAVALHRFVQQTCQIGYQGRVPRTALDEDLKNLQAYDQTRCVSGDAVDFYPRHPYRPGDLILSHFLDLDQAPRHQRRGCLVTAAKRARLVFKIARRLARTGKRITSHNVMKTIRRKYGPQVLFAKTYAVLLSRLGAESVFDPDPETGVKALACAIMGIPYFTRPNPLFDAALRRGFAGFIGLDHRYVGAEGEDQPDCTIVDRNLASFDYGAALDLAEVSRRLVVYVPGDRKMEAVAECAPDSIVDALMGYGTLGHYFIW